MSQFIYRAGIYFGLVLGALCWSSGAFGIGEYIKKPEWKHIYFLEARPGVSQQQLAIRDRPSQAGEAVSYLRPGDIVAIRVLGNYLLDRERMEAANAGVWRQLYNPKGRPYFVYDHWANFKHLDPRKRTLMLTPRKGREFMTHIIYNEPGYVDHPDCVKMKNLCSTWPEEEKEMLFYGSKLFFVKSQNKNGPRIQPFYQVFPKNPTDKEKKQKNLGWVPARPVRRVITEESLKKPGGLELGPQFGLSGMTDYQFVNFANKGRAFNRQDTQHNVRLGLHAYAPFVMDLEARGNFTVGIPIKGPEGGTGGLTMLRLEEFLLMTLPGQGRNKFKLAAGGNMLVFLGENPGYAFDSLASFQGGVLFETPNLSLAFHAGPVANSEGFRLSRLEADLDMAYLFPSEKSIRNWIFSVRVHAINFSSEKRDVKTLMLSAMIGLEKAF